MDQWERCAPYLQKALDLAGNPYSRQSVKDRCDDGAAQFWPFARAAVVTEIVDYPLYRVLHLWLIGGEDLMELLRFLPSLERWGREMGCKRIEGRGRPEWGRVAGFEITDVYLGKEL